MPEVSHVTTLPLTVTVPYSALLWMALMVLPQFAVPALAAVSAMTSVVSMFTRDVSLMRMISPFFTGIYPDVTTPVPDSSSPALFRYTPDLYPVPL